MADPAADGKLTTARSDVAGDGVPNDDLGYVRARLASYRAYADEGDRHDSDMRVRAHVGSALTDAQTRLRNSLDEPTQTLLEAVLMRCMFTDQVFIRKFEHGELDRATVDALVHSDRDLVELADRARTADVATLRDTLHAIDREFGERRSPTPVA